MNSIPSAVWAVFGAGNGVVLGEVAYEIATSSYPTDKKGAKIFPEQKYLGQRMIVAAAATGLFVQGIANIMNAEETVMIFCLEYGAASTLAFLAAKDATSEKGLGGFREWCSLYNNAPAVYTASWRTLAGIAASVGTDAIVRLLPGFFQPARVIVDSVVLVGFASANFQEIAGYLTRMKNNLSMA